MIHTDVEDYPAVLREASRVLVPGGCLVHIGVHPCFCGGFADRSNSEAIVLRPGYLDGHWTKESWTEQGLRDKVGAQHIPLPELLQTFVDVGLVLGPFSGGRIPHSDRAVHQGTKGVNGMSPPVPLGGTSARRLQ